MLPGVPGFTENTLPGLHACLAHGYNVECDVQVLHDNQTLIVFHDDTLDRLVDLTCRVRGPVANLTPSTLRNIILAGDTPIPLLTDALDIVSQWLADHPEDDRFRMNIELKSKGTAGPTIALLQQRFSDWVLRPHHIILSSFYWDELTLAAQEWRRLKLDVELAVLSERDAIGAMQVAKTLGAGRIHLSAEVATQQVISTLHEREFRVAFYTVDAPQKMAKLCRWGADALFTNRPDRLYSQLDLLAA
jgi:glycerophosphoryl diester phosphodiesterase